MQDYLGAIIVFIALLTALITSYLLPNETPPSLVAMALQYTLLIPIYLNWVVQLSANMEMYFGACERISYCIESGNQEAEEKSSVDTMRACKYSLPLLLLSLSPLLVYHYNLFPFPKMNHCPKSGHSMAALSSVSFR
jgi:hypothetical protein